MNSACSIGSAGPFGINLDFQFGGGFSKKATAMPLREGNSRLGTLHLWNLTGDSFSIFMDSSRFLEIVRYRSQFGDSNQLGAVVQEKMGEAPSQPGLFPD
jgi:hypothetical protein